MSSRRRFQRQARQQTPEWFPRLTKELDRCGVKRGAETPKVRPEVQKMSAEHGAIVDALMLRDRGYFLAHPEETEYVRPAEAGDLPEAGMVFDPSQQWYVRVTNIADGIRNRYIFGVPFQPSERCPQRN